MRRLIPLLILLFACSPTSGDRAPDDVLAKARALAECGKLDEARDALHALDAEHSFDARVALLAGEVATWRGYADEGLDWMRRAAERAPTNPEPHLRAAYILLVHSGDGASHVGEALGEAALAFEDADGVESASYRACRGEAAWISDDEGAAEMWFRGSLALQPGCRWSLQRLLQIVAGKGPDAEDERATLNARLSELIRSQRSGEGMENARQPVSFCGR